MQTYNIKRDEKLSEHDYVLELVDNELSIPQKMEQLISSYQQLKLDPTGFNRLLKYLCQRLNMTPYFPRKGDVNERYDLIMSDPSSDKQVMCEVEIPSIAILDAPRNLLDDIAVLSNRRGIPASQLTPLVICWDFPNKRTDYWNVISDIHNIVGLKVKTCSILSLAILVWANKPFDFESDLFFLDSEKNKLEGILRILDEKSIDEGDYKGFFYPLK